VAARRAPWPDVSAGRSGTRSAHRPVVWRDVFTERGGRRGRRSSSIHSHTPLALHSLAARRSDLQSSGNPRRSHPRRNKVAWHLRCQPMSDGGLSSEALAPSALSADAAHWLATLKTEITCPLSEGSAVGYMMMLIMIMIISPGHVCSDQRCLTASSIISATPR